MQRSERAKMLAGEPYLGADPELAAMRLAARARVRALNAIDDEAVPAYRATLLALLGEVGEPVSIVPPFACDYGCHIAIGDDVEINFGCVILDCNRVWIGAGARIAPRVVISAATHPVDPDERRKGPELAFPVHIGRNVWIGASVVIGPGVTIGDDTTIGAGSIVLRDVPARVLAAGNPCRVIRAL